MEIKELEARFCELERGEVHVMSIANLIRFKVKISWQGEMNPTFSVMSIECLPFCSPESLLGKTLTDPTFVDSYFAENGTSLLDTFQKKITEFNYAAEDWGVRNHNNYLAFYENHVW